MTLISSVCSMFISNRSSVTIVRWPKVYTSTYLHSLLGMVDRWAGLAHGPQIYCFSPFSYVFTLKRVCISSSSRCRTGDIDPQW